MRLYDENDFDRDIEKEVHQEADEMEFIIKDNEEPYNLDERRKKLDCILSQKFYNNETSNWVKYVIVFVVIGIIIGAAVYGYSTCGGKPEVDCEPSTLDQEANQYPE